MVIGSRWSLAALCAFWVTFAGWVVSVEGGTPETGLLSIRPGGAWDVWLPAAYLLAFAATLVGTAWWLRRLNRDYEDRHRDRQRCCIPVTRTQLAVADGLGTTARRSTVSPGNTVT